MLRSEDNELLCRVGPGTPIGELFRSFWVPALIPAEVLERVGFIQIRDSHNL